MNQSKACFTFLSKLRDTKLHELTCLFEKQRGINKKRIKKLIESRDSFNARVFLFCGVHSFIYFIFNKIGSPYSFVLLIFLMYHVSINNNLTVYNNSGNQN